MLRKISKLLTAALFTFAAVFTPFASSAFAAVGDPINATATIAPSALASMENNEFQFDDQTITSGVAFNYISTGASHTISFVLSFEAGSLVGNSVGSVTLNGASVPFDNLGEDRYSFSVPELDSYNIDFSIVNDGPSYNTIIWANPGATDIDSEDALISHGSAHIVAVYRGADDQLVDPAEYTQSGATGGVDANGNGWAMVQSGDRVVFEFVPEYGYQLTSVMANGLPLEPQETINQYTFNMPSTNIHFAADFTPTSDVVAIASDKVASGSVTLGSGAISNGTARISVSDADLSTNKIAEFTTAANGYTISDYLDIDFFNIFYKGKADSSDVWSNQLHELGGEATITLTLDDDIDVANVAIVHNIGDGDEFEIIEIDSYDTAAHTITFRTRSFSSFAIASKDTAAGAPDSGYATKTIDGVTANTALAFLAAVIVSAAVLAFAVRVKKHQN